MTVVDKPIRIISISPAAYDSPYSPAITASAEETGYENLESLNGQTAAVPIQSSSASAGSDDNQYNYDESSTDDLKACYEPIAKDVDPEFVCPKPEPVSQVVKTQDYLHKTMYLGEMSRSMAESACRKKASFFLYNRFPSGHNRINKHMPPHLPLFIVYRTSAGDHCHYRIVDKDVMGSKSPSQFSAPRRQHHLNEYRVDISGEPYFSSLKALVSYYLTYVMVSKEGATDIFPWWRTKNEYLNRADIYADSK
uniref:SH2 domain-containing protein n=2 Tax=Ditylenchus dipsaci TaxID=166011 RepID=A0A915CZX4_9BILA